MDKQKEFDGMPERSPLGKKAIEYLNKKDEVDRAKEELEKIRVGLGMLFTASDECEIKIENRSISCSMSEKERISVRYVTKG